MRCFDFVVALRWYWYWYSYSNLDSNWYLYLYSYSYCYSIRAIGIGQAIETESVAECGYADDDRNGCGNVIEVVFDFVFAAAVAVVVADIGLKEKIGIENGNGSETNADVVDLVDFVDVGVDVVDVAVVVAAVVDVGVDVDVVADVVVVVAGSDSDFDFVVDVDNDTIFLLAVISGPNSAYSRYYLQDWKRKVQL